jgi:hypothetical protein
MPRNCFHILSVPCRCQHLFDIILKHLLASFIVMPRTTSELETSLTSKSSTARTLIHHFFISNSLKHGAIRIPRSHLSPNPNMARKRVAGLQDRRDDTMKTLQLVVELYFNATNQDLSIRENPFMITSRRFLLWREI